MVLIIDNYDSFTFNLVQTFGAIGIPCEVYRNDRITPEEIERRNPAHIVISPGPCTPKEGGISNEVVRRFMGTIPILGVCLGHQCIAYALGAEIVRAPELMHGKTSMIHHDRKTIFRDIPEPFEATRYHSLVVKRDTLPACFVVSAWTKRGDIMGIRHNACILEGVQFHPESFLTNQGQKLLENFLALSSGR